MNNKTIIIIAVIFLLLCCITTVVVAAFAFMRFVPVSSDIFDNSDTPISVTPDYNGSSQSVFVDELRINVMESFPVQVSATVIGNLPDGCTRIVSSRSEMIDDSTFVLSIETTRPADAICTQALVPFEETIPLEVEGLPAGTYLVKGFGMETSFTLEVDNR